MDNNDPPPIPRPGRSLAKRFLIGTLLIGLLSGTATAAVGFLETRNLIDAISKGPKLHLGASITEANAGDPQTILVLGSDRRYLDIKEKNDVRSDTMILVRLDPHRKATAVMSLPRDLKVDIPLPNGLIQTDKINAAYALGGPKLTVQTVKRLLGININHVINVNFGGFRRAVNYVGCIYADIDRRYFNDNSGFGEDYATIDIQAGYQKLCGQDALDYVRFRHTDTDIVRNARQQDFLRQAKDQVGVKKIISDRKALTRIFGRYTQTDISKHNQIWRLLKLVIFSAGHPIREVHMDVSLDDPQYVIASPEAIATARRQFLNVKGSKGPRGKLSSTKAERKSAHKRKHRKLVEDGLAAGLEDAKTAGEDQAVVAATQTKLPIYYPRLRTPLATYSDLQPRVYHIRDTDGKLHRAYRMVIKKGTVGEYYGVQGTDWMNPPLLNNPSEERTIRGRKLELFFDGSRLRLVAWRTDHAVYWVSNTLLESVNNRQMLAIARSLTRIGR